MNCVKPVEGSHRFDRHQCSNAPLPCKFPSVGLHLVAVSIRTCLLKARLSQDLVCRVSFFGRYVVELSSHSRPSRVRAPVYRGCPACTHGGCHRVQDDPVRKSQPLCVLFGVVTSCVLCARVRGRVSRSCAVENTYTPLRLEALFKLSVVAILRHLYRSLQHLCGCTQNPSTCSTRSFFLSAVSQSTLFK